MRFYSLYFCLLIEGFTLEGGGAGGLLAATTFMCKIPTENEIL